MTYKFQARLRSEWVLEKPGGEVFALGDILRLLSAIDTLGHIAGACRESGLSYRHGWGLLRRAEKEFDTSLLETSRRQGTRLTPFAQHLLWANRRVDARLAPTLQSMSSELQEELDSLYPESRPRLRLHASHGFAVEGLIQQAGQHDTLSIELRYRTAIEALASLNRGECDLAGFQVPTGEFEQPILEHYSPWLDTDRHCLVYLAQRDTGMFVHPDNPKGIHTIADLVKPDVRFVNRQTGSSTRLLVGLMLSRLGIDTAQVVGYDSSEFTHMAIAAHVASGMADVGIGVETAAWRCGLAFIPLAKERYFFAVNRDSLETPQMQQLLALLKGEAYRDYVAGLAGYESRNMGQVLALEEAFPLGATKNEGGVDAAQVWQKAMSKVFYMAPEGRASDVELQTGQWQKGQPLQDTRKRPLRDLRISVTDRCNFRCTYCMPREVFDANYPFMPHASLLSFEEITRLASVAVSQGVQKIRLTGGEPLLRKDIEKLVAMLAQLRTPQGDPVELTLTTNATLLRKKAAALKEAGLNRVTVSLDALDPALFEQMSDSQVAVETVLDGIQAAAEVGLAPVKVNMVVRKGLNDSQILPMAEYFRNSGHVLRFIEYMDVGSTNGWNLDEVVTGKEILALIGAQYPLEPVKADYVGEVAERWRYQDGSGEIGVITSVSHPFCGDCSRARMSPEGRLYLCLFADQGYDLRAVLRGGASNEELAAHLAGIWQGRTDRYSEQRGKETVSRRKIEMSYIGG